MFFSIIIPLYNKENFIENTIKSVLNQTFTDFEIIVIDDCSTDESLSKLTLIENDKIQIIKHTKNKGLSASRNTGIKIAKSKYVVFIDADDTWNSYFLSEIKKLILTFPNAGIFGTNYQEKYKDGLHILIKKNIRFSKNEIGLIDDFYKANLKQPIYCYSSVAFKKEVFDKVGYFDENITFGEDTDFNIRVNYRYKLAYSNKICVNYLVFSENQITNSTILDKVVTNFDKYEDYFKESLQIKKFLDFNRYILASKYYLAGEKIKFRILKNKIDKRNLTTKQWIMINSPIFIVKKLKFIKNILLKKGVRVTTYK